MRTLHIVSHTHWDREWYRTFQQFRLRLVELVDELLEILEKDKNYKFFMLDGQTIILDDYLALRPENENVLRDHIRKDRILIGPWHVLPDMFLVSPEAHIRNLLEGDRTARKFGPKMMIGYMPDSFGHFAQMPQLIRGFGMDVISLWRGPDDQPAEFWWDAPDGSRVLMAYERDSYSNGAGLQTAVPSEFAAGLKRAGDSLAAHSAFNDVLIMLGTDHMLPSRDTSKVVAYANAALRNTKVVHSTLRNYVKAIKSQISKSKIELPAYSGELRSSKHSHLLPGILSTRMWIKQRNQTCETLLEKWAEPFSFFASLTTIDHGPQTIVQHPSSIVHEAWRLLMECHPHDSICGCSIDQVHEEMKSRFDQAEQIGEELTRRSLETLATSIKTDQRPKTVDGQSSIVIFNPSSFPRTDLITAELSLPIGVQDFDILDENGVVIPHQSVSGQTSDASTSSAQGLMNVRVRREELGPLIGMVHEGRAGNLSVQEIQFSREDETVRIEVTMAEDSSPNLSAWARGSQEIQNYIADVGVKFFHIHAHTPNGTQVTFAAPNVPSLGWRSFTVRAKESQPTEVHITPLMKFVAPLAASPLVQKTLARLVRPKSRPSHRIENEFFIAEATRDGTLTITDKRDGQIYRGVNRFVDGGDCGDEYNFCPPHSDMQAVGRLKNVRVTRGPVLQTLEIDLGLLVPEELAPNRESRARHVVPLSITTRVTLISNVPRIDIRTNVDNRAKDHRLRVHFPTPFATDSADYDGHFEVRNRKIGLPSFDETWMEEPRPEAPQRAFTDVSDDSCGLMLANRGLPEVEVLKNKDGNSEIALTLLRCVGWLSRDDFPARRGHAGPFLETTAAQMQGTWTFDYSIIPHAGNWEGAHQQAYAFGTPLRGINTDLHNGSLPTKGSFVEVSPSAFAVSAVKESEDGRGWIVRGVNLTDEPTQVSIKPWKKFKSVERVNLAEQKIGPLKAKPDGSIIFTARGHEIVTILFSG